MGSLKRNRKVILGYTLEFLVLAGILLYNFGNFSLIKGDDGMNQFFPAFVYCGKYIREVLKGFLHGQFSIPQFDFSIGMGESPIQTINYYGFGDPFMIFSALVPVKYATYGYTAVMLLKMYVSGFGFIYYCRKRKMSAEGILTGLPFYVASNYLFYFCFQYPPYQSVLITLPYLCAGLDELIHNKESKKKVSVVLILSVAFQALYGFYLLYMELLFAAVYAFISLLCVTKSFKKLLSQIGVLFLHIVAGLFTGGIMFIPTVVGFLNSSRGGDFYLYSWKVLLRMGATKYWEAFSVIIVPEGFSTNGLLIPAIGVLAFILAMKKISGVKEIKILSVFFLLAYVETTLTSYVAGGFAGDIWHNRWIFTLAFLLAILMGMGVQSLCEMKAKGWLIFCGVNVLYIVVLFLLERTLFMEQMSGQRGAVYVVYGIFTVITAVLFIAAEKMNFADKATVKKRMVPICVVAAVGLNIFTVFGTVNDYGFGGKWNFKQYESVTNELQASNAQLYNTDGENFARMDINGNAENEALYMGYHGVQEYFSMINGNIHDFYSYFLITKGLNAEKHHLEGLDSRSGIEDLLAVAYYDDVKENVVVDNSNHLPLGFTFDTYLTTDEAEEMSVITRNARALDTVVLEQDVEGVKKAEKIDESTLWTEENCKVEFVNIEKDGNRIKVNPDSRILVTVESVNDGEAYIYTKQMKIETAEIRENFVYFGDSRSRFICGVSEGNLKEQSGLFCMGNIESGKSVFEITFDGTAEYTMDDIHVYTIFTDKTEEFRAKRQEGSLQNIVVGNDKITADIAVEQKEVLFLSVPYSSGWKAWVNGKETEILKADYGFSALVLEAGENEICMKYSTPGLKAGIACTLLGLIAIGVYEVQKRKKEKA